MRLLSAALVLTVLATAATPREGTAEIRWTSPAAERSELLVMVRNAEGAPILLMREPVEAGATRADLLLPPLTRQAASVQAGMVETGRVVAQSPVKPVSAREVDLRLEMRSLLAVGFDDHWLCEDSAALVRISSSDEGLHARHGHQVVQLTEGDEPDHYTGPGESRIALYGNLAEIALGGQDLGICHPSLFTPIMPLRIAALDSSWLVEMGLETALLNLPGLAQDTVAASGLSIRSLRDGEIRITGPSLSISLRDEPCRARDGILPFPFTAELQTGADGLAVAGCAGNPLDLLAGGVWRVRSIYGRPLDAQTPMLTLQISGAEISGRTPCNRYVGTAAIINSQLSFGELGATRLACPAEQRNIEQRFLDALEIATSFDLWRNGGLSLRAGSVAVLTATRD